MNTPEHMRNPFLRPTESVDGPLALHMLRQSRRVSLSQAATGTGSPGQHWPRAVSVRGSGTKMSPWDDTVRMVANT